VYKKGWMGMNLLFSLARRKSYNSFLLCLTRLLVLHDWVGEGAVRFGFDGGCALVLGSGVAGSGCWIRFVSTLGKFGMTAATWSLFRGWTIG